MGVKVEGVRSDERVALVDTTARNRKMLLGGGAGVVVLVLIIVIVMATTKSTPSYGPSNAQFRINFAGTPVASNSSQIPSKIQISSSVTNVQSWRYGNGTVLEIVQTETIAAGGLPLDPATEAAQILEPVLPNGSQVTIGGVPGVEQVSQSSAQSLSAAYPWSDTALLLRGNQLYIVSAAGATQAEVTSFVHSFQAVS